MKKFIIATILILGIIPNFDGNITLVSEANAQMMAYEFPGEDECSNSDETMCIFCGTCYDTYTYSSCPSCGTLVKCDVCQNHYSSTEGHDCPGSSSGSGSGSGSSSDGYRYDCTSCGRSFYLKRNVFYAECPFCHGILEPYY